MQGESAREISQGQEEGYFRKEMFRVVKSMDPGARLHGFESVTSHVSSVRSLDCLSPSLVR